MKKISLILILIICLNLILIPGSFAINGSNSLLQKVNSSYKKYINGVKSGKDNSEIQKLKSEYEYYLKKIKNSHRVIIGHKNINNQYQKSKYVENDEYYDIDQLKNQERAKSVGAIMTMGATIIACAGSVGLLGPVVSTIISTTMAVPGIYMWQWGTRKIKKNKIEYSIKNFDDEIKKKDYQISLGATLSIIGLNILSFGALGLINPLFAVLAGSAISFGGTYLWKWGLSLPGFVKKDREYMSMTKRERIIDNAGVMLSMAGTVAMALGSIAAVPTVPAILLGSMLSVTGSYLWRFGLKPLNLRSLLTNKKATAH